MFEDSYPALCLTDIRQVENRAAIARWLSGRAELDSTHSRDLRHIRRGKVCRVELLYQFQFALVSEHLSTLQYSPDLFIIPYFWENLFCDILHYGQSSSG
jgi:hypothetical protein